MSATAAGGGAGGPRPLRTEHYVSPEPFDPHSIEALTEEQERYFLASQWRMMWWRLKRHRLAVLSGAILAVLYFVVVFAEAIAPYGVHSRNVEYVYAPPQAVHWFRDGELVGPFVYDYDVELDLEYLARVYTENEARPMPLRFFCLGEPYRLWGVVPARFHLVCPAEGGVMFLLGTDRLGRDVLSRIVHGARVSLTIGIIGIAISFVIGLTLGGSPATTAAGSTGWCSGSSRSSARSRSCPSGWRSRPRCR